MLDGHNRLEICRKHGLDFQVRKISLVDRQAAVDWVIVNQLARRNLTRDQWEYLVGTRYNRQKRQGARTDLTSDQNDTKLQTADKLAAEYGVSPATIKRAGKTASWLLADLQDEIDTYTLMLEKSLLTQEEFAEAVRRAGRLPSAPPPDRRGSSGQGRNAGRPVNLSEIPPGPTGCRTPLCQAGAVPCRGFRLGGRVSPAAPRGLWPILARLARKPLRSDPGAR